MGVEEVVVEDVVVAVVSRLVLFRWFDANRHLVRWYNWPPLNINVNSTVSTSVIICSCVSVVNPVTCL
jgi:hypothetical protein